MTCPLTRSRRWLNGGEYDRETPATGTKTLPFSVMCSVDHARTHAARHNCLRIRCGTKPSSDYEYPQSKVIRAREPPIVALHKAHPRSNLAPPPGWTVCHQKHLNVSRPTMKTCEHTQDRPVFTRPCSTPVWHRVASGEQAPATPPPPLPMTSKLETGWGRGASGESRKISNSGPRGRFQKKYSGGGGGGEEVNNSIDLKRHARPSRAGSTQANFCVQAPGPLKVKRRVHRACCDSSAGSIEYFFFMRRVHSRSIAGYIERIFIQVPGPSRFFVFKLENALFDGVPACGGRFRVGHGHRHHS